MPRNRKKGKTPKEKKPLSHGWIVVPSKTYPDRVYFYNTITKCSTWKNPCETNDDRSTEKSSSDSSSPKKSRSRRRNGKSSEAFIENSKFEIPVLNINEKNDIEDYDEEQDQYFENIPNGSYGLSHSRAFSPSNSPDPFFSPEAIRNADVLKSNMAKENNKKELWEQFACSPENPKMKKSIALSDLEKPSTSTKTSEVEFISRKNRQISRSCSLLNNNVEIPSKDVTSNSKKKKKKKKEQSEKVTLKKKDCDKIINNITFKRKDKTPAQTHLLRLRQKNTESLKNYVASYSDLTAPKNQNSDLGSGSIQSLKTSEPMKSDDFSDDYLKRTEIYNNGIIERIEENSITNFSEEMDWEPSCVELDVQNINEFRNQRDKINKLSNDTIFGINSDNTPLSPSLSNSWILVLDTNILVSCLNFIKELRDTNVSGVGYPTLYIPWRVLQELDHLKDSKINTLNSKQNDKQLHWNVRKAINYLNENFKSKHPRCFGQSFEDFTKMVEDKVSAPDDEILQTCIKLQKLHADKKLTLLTNDKNLESKAILSGVEVYAKDRFCKKYFSSNEVDVNLSSPTHIFEAEVMQIDKIICAVKSILRNCIPLVVETEMKIAFQGDWVKLAYKKPPWTLQDSLDCFLKHWRSVFFLVFSKDTLSEVKKLYDRLFRKEQASSQNVCQTINVIQRLINSIRKSQKDKRPYMELLDASVTELSSLLEEMSKIQSSKEQTVSTSSHIETPQFSDANGSFIQTNPTSEKLNNDIFQIKNLFRNIWETLRNFCCSVSDIVNSSSGNHTFSIPEIRLKLSQILNEVGELIVTVDKIFEISFNDINENHPLILHLSNFLIKLYPTMTPDLINRLPLCLKHFFSDLEGRTLLSGSLLDFREFLRDLMKATEYFDRNYPNL